MAHALRTPDPRQPPHPAPAAADNDNARGRAECGEPPARGGAITLVVENMHCGGCLRKVEAALAAVPGVASARANLTARRATAEPDPAARIEAPALIAALEQAGFKAAELAVTDDATKTAADSDYMKRLAVAGFAAANVMLLSVSVWSGTGGDMPAGLKTLFHWLSAAIALPAMVYAGQPFYRSALAALGSGRVNMDVPISIGVTLAAAMSVWQTVRGSDQVYFDAAITLLFFLLVGRALDQRMRVRAASAAANLAGMRTLPALVVLPDGTTRRVSARNLVPGMRLLTAAGERFAADARIVRGETEVDESLVSGETRPRAVAAGDHVLAGTVNLGQPVASEAVATDERTVVAEIARLMAAAEQGRAAYVRLADRAARLYAPAVHVLGLATFLGWMALGHGWEAALTAAIAVLIITCPCALALAVPAVQVAATGRLFANGVLVKAPDALERLAGVDTVVLDKTGTLTLGELLLTDAAALDAGTLARAASLASISRHPYAKAVVRAARARGIAVAPAEGALETAGLGLAVTGADGREERLGSAGWCGVTGPEAAAASLWWRGADAASIPLRLADRLRPDAPEVVRHLAAAGIAVELVSGDRRPEVDRIAAEAGIGERMAETTPAGKVARLHALAAAGRRVLMVGDGLNDAPALAAAHASVSPAMAADLAQTAADCVFQGEALAPVLETIAVARAAERMARQNFAIAVGYNVVFVPLAVVGLATPLIAAVAMSASSIAVTLNAVRLRTRRLSLATPGTERSAP